MIDVFVISPYTSADPDVVEYRIEEAEKYIVSLVNMGLVPYSTIASFGHLIRKYDMRPDYEFWQNHCEQMIAASKEVHVLQLDGWEESPGSQAEILVAIEIGKDIKYVYPTRRSV